MLTRFIQSKHLRPMQINLCLDAIAQDRAPH